MIGGVQECVEFKVHSLHTIRCILFVLSDKIAQPKPNTQTEPQPSGPVRFDLGALQRATAFGGSQLHGPTACCRGNVFEFGTPFFQRLGS